MQTTLIAAVVMFVGLASLLGGFKSYRRYRMVRDIPRSAIRALAMGLVEIQGKIKQLETLQAPFSGTECVWFAYTVEEYRYRKKGSSWRTIARDDRRLPFLACDNSGEVRVEPEGAELLSDVRREYKDDVGFFEGIWSTFDKIGDTSSKTLEALDLGRLEPIHPGQLTTWSNGDRRLKEQYLAPGDIVYIMGTAAEDRERPGKTVVRKGSNNPMFFVGDKPEEEMISKLRKKTAAGTIFAIVGIVGGLALLLHNLGWL